MSQQQYEEFNHSQGNEQYPYYPYYNEYSTHSNRGQKLVETETKPSLGRAVIAVASFMLWCFFLFCFILSFNQYGDPPTGGSNVITTLLAIGLIFLAIFLFAINAQLKKK